MAYKFIDFLVSLSETEQLQLYINNPERALENARLSSLQKDAIRTGDQYRITRLCAMDMVNDSIHAQRRLRIFQEYDPDFTMRGSDANADMVNDTPNDVAPTTVDNNSADNAVSDVVAELNRAGRYFDHLFSQRKEDSQANEVVFVGTGIDGTNHLTAESLSYISTANIVLYCVADLVIERRLQTLNSNWNDLYRFYADDKPRRQTYDEMVNEILAAVRQFPLVCAVFYGHPGIFVWPSYKTIQVARQEGYVARMLPAVSSLDCLFCDVGFDPSRYSCQIFEATDLLLRGREPNIGASVVIFQPGCVGELGWNSRGYEGRNIPVLADYLSSFYGHDYEVILYEAAQYPVCRPKIKRIAISKLADARPSGMSTLYIPAKTQPRVDEDMVERLGLRAAHFPTAASTLST